MHNRLYAGGGVSGNMTNNMLRDEHTLLYLPLYQAYRLNNFQLWYGGGFNDGQYRVGNVDWIYKHFQYLKDRGGKKFYSGITAHAGITYIIPLSLKIEWRVVGVQAILQRGYGGFLRFRIIMEEDQVSIQELSIHPWLLTMNFSTEVTLKTDSKRYVYFRQINLLTGYNYNYDLCHYPQEPAIRRGARYTYFTSII